MLKQPDLEKDRSVMMAVLEETRDNGGYWDVAAYELGYDMYEVQRMLETYPDFKEAIDGAPDFATRSMYEVYMEDRRKPRLTKLDQQ